MPRGRTHLLLGGDDAGIRHADANFQVNVDGLSNSMAKGNEHLASRIHIHTENKAWSGEGLETGVSVQLVALWCT